MEATALVISALVKAVSPVISDLYKSSKGKTQTELAKWSSQGQARKIAKTLIKLERVKTLWSPDDEVSISDFYYPSRILYERTPQAANSVDDLPDGNLVIQGIVGQGKSIFLRFMSSTAIRSSKSAKIPIFLELRTLSPKFSLKQAIFKIFENIDAKISEDSFCFLADSGKICLFLDGFDEIPNDVVRETILEIEHLSTRHPEMKIIVSSRPHNEIQKVSGFRIIPLSPLTPAEYPGFLEKMGLSQIKRNETLAAIHSSSSRVSGIITTPLMMTLVVIVYESEREIPPTLPEFFERLFQVVFSRHDRLKAGFERKHYSGLSERKLQELFEAFCFMTIQIEYGRSLNNEQFNEVFDRALEYSEDCKCEVEKFKLDITKVACLMLEEGIDLTTFLHKSILEYYAAAFIKHSPDSVSNLFYEHCLQNYRGWKDVLKFLKNIDPYRYAKEYALIDAEKTFSEISNLLTNKKKSELVRFIKKYHPNIGIMINPRKGIKTAAALIGGFGPYEHATSASLEDLPEHLIRAMEDSVSSALTSNELKSLASKSDIGNTNEEDHITINILIEKYGESAFWSHIGIFENELHISIESFKKTIETQDRKKLIFERKPK